MKKVLASHILLIVICIDRVRFHCAEKRLETPHNSYRSDESCSSEDGLSIPSSSGRSYKQSAKNPTMTSSSVLETMSTKTLQSDLASTGVTMGETTTQSSTPDMTARGPSTVSEPASESTLKTGGLTSREQQNMPDTIPDRTAPGPATVMGPSLGARPTVTNLPGEQDKFDFNINKHCNRKVSTNTNKGMEIAENCSREIQAQVNSLEVGKSLNMSGSYVDVFVTVINATNFRGFRHELSASADDVTSPREEVVIPSEILDVAAATEADLIGISIVLYKTGDLFIDQKLNSSDYRRRPLSNVVSITVSVNGSAISVPVEYALQHTQLTNNGTHQENSSCEFYDMRSANEGEWSDYGCRVIDFTSNFTQCACNHTTHFGVLLQVREIENPHTTALNLISYIGGGVSTGCLVVTLFILNYLKSLSSDRVRIHKHLISALIVAQLVFLLEPVASKNEISCRATALLLHYFYLAVFCWSLLEGANLYSQIVKVFATGKRIKYWHYLLFGWGVPIPIVAISAGVRWDNYGVTPCFLTTADYLIWSFAGPVLFVIIVNFIILLMVLRVIVTSAAAVKADEETYSHVKAGAKGALLLIPILGLGWVFGFLSLNKQTRIFTYLFVIAVVTQGFLIFLLYCVFNSEVRSALARKREQRRLCRGEGLARTDQTSSSLRSRETNESSASFASKLLDKLKKPRASTPSGKGSTPVDIIQFSQEYEIDGKSGDTGVEHEGSVDSGYAPTLKTSVIGNHGHGGSAASIGVNVVAEEVILPNTPYYV